MPKSVIEVANSFIVYLACSICGSKDLAFNGFGIPYDDDKKNLKHDVFQVHLTCVDCDNETCYSINYLEVDKLRKRLEREEKKKRKNTKKPAKAKIIQLMR